MRIFAWFAEWREWVAWNKLQREAKLVERVSSEIHSDIHDFNLSIQSGGVPNANRDYAAKLIIDIVRSHDRRNS